MKEWYDGFKFGQMNDIYNPWSILNYLEKQKFFIYWANTSSNSLVAKLLREGNRKIKICFENLMQESGFGRYDIILMPKKEHLQAIIMEFKVRQPRREKSLEETVQAALDQIEAKKYEEEVVEAGFARESIRKYGFAFEGKTVLIEGRE